MSSRLRKNFILADFFVAGDCSAAHLPYVNSAALVLVAFVLFFATPAWAAPEESNAFEELIVVVEEAKHGTFPLDELSDMLIAAAEKHKEFPAGFIAKTKRLEGLAAVLASRIQEKVSKLLSSGSSEQLLLLRSFSVEALADEDLEKANLAHLFEELARSERLFAGNRISDLIKLAFKYQEDSETQFLPFIVDLVHRAARSTIEEGKPLAALTWLSELEDIGRVKKTYDLGFLALAALEQLEEDSDPLEKGMFDDKRIEVFLSDLVVNKPSSTRVLVNLYSKKVLSLTKEQDWVTAEDYFLRILALRPDPNPENKELRLQILSLVSSEDAPPYIIARIEELKYAGEFGYKAKLRLLCHGHYGVFFPLLYVTVVLLFFVILLVVYANRAAVLDWMMARERYVDGSDEAFETEEKKKRKPKHLGSGYSRPLTAPDEYSSLLAVFDLDDDATENDIRNAYRTKVKNYHPDSAEDDELVDDFMEIKAIYDRILEIRGSWFGGKR